MTTITIPHDEIIETIIWKAVQERVSMWKNGVLAVEARYNSNAALEREFQDTAAHHKTAYITLISLIASLTDADPDTMVEAYISAERDYIAETLVYGDQFIAAKFS